MKNSNIGTIIVTGPTGGLGRATVLEMARRSKANRPDLILIGRAGEKLTHVLKEVRDAGATAYEVTCDFSKLSDVRAAAKKVKEILKSGKVRPLQGLAANAGLSTVDTRQKSADGYELTFAVNYLTNAQLIEELLDSFVEPARIVLVGSDTYYENALRKRLGVPPSDWRDPIELAAPSSADTTPTAKLSGTAYSNSKLAVLYYAHELQRHTSKNTHVIVYEPGWMPTTGLSRNQSIAVRMITRLMSRLPSATTPEKSAPHFASVLLDEEWADVKDGEYIILQTPTELQPFAHDKKREARLWEATSELIAKTK